MISGNLFLVSFVLMTVSDSGGTSNLILIVGCSCSNSSISDRYNDMLSGLLDKNSNVILSSFSSWLQAANKQALNKITTNILPILFTFHPPFHIGLHNITDWDMRGYAFYFVPIFIVYLSLCMFF